MKKTLFLVLLITITALSCKKTVESEQKSWESNIRRANQLAVEFPNFSVLIREQIDAAQKTMNDASAITDEKAKIEKMTEANVQIMKGFVRNLEDIKDKKASINKKFSDSRLLSPNFYEGRMIIKAVTDGEVALDNADNRIRTIVNSRSEADALTGLILSDLKNADTNLENSIKVVKDRVAAEKAKVEETQKQQLADKAAKEQAEAPVICKYCGTSNPATSLTCKGCGASLK